MKITRTKVKHFRHHKPKRKSRSNTVVHVRTRSNNQHNSLHSNHTINRTRHQRNDPNSVKHSENTPTKFYQDPQSTSQPPPNTLQKQKFILPTSDKRESRSKLSQDFVKNNSYHIQTKNAWLKPPENTIDYHHNATINKNKYSSQYVKISIITIAIILVVAAISIPLALLTQPKTTTTTPIAILRWNKTGITVAGNGTAGIASNQLNGPLDAILDNQNSLYVADRANHRIQKYMMGASHGTTVAGNANATLGTSLSALHRPSQVLILANDDMYVADTYNHRIMFWSNGSSSGILAAGVTGNFNSTLNNTLNSPYHIDYNVVSNVLYVSDYANSRIMGYASGVSSRFLVAGGTGYGISITQLTDPVGIYFDSISNSLIIANHFAHNIVRWPLGATSWTLLAGDIHGNPGDNATMLRYPTVVTLDPMGNLYVADRNNHRIQLFLNNHTEGLTIAGTTNVSGSDSTLLSAPWSVALDSQLNLYVADSNNHRVQNFHGTKANFHRCELIILSVSRSLPFNKTYSVSHTTC